MMLHQLTQEKLLFILKEAQKLGDTNHSLTSKDLVKEIEKMLIIQPKVKSI
ncbi:hypothetical protein H1D32_07995 [Anaerobacillus sp. CMMVII]|uniref:hypothetical protein n=1 Tax=Anaerobacillus sp. CMMVII TaxID=2755588 RepID=UPI0021B76A43|nr:hypothetical protein [Anaerobacillus sp. CMMVII]MCT8137704.1 hypothetical protein [Anaerobacillus sp. CMMVII]